MSERYELTSEQTSEWPSTSVCIPGYSGPKWSTTSLTGRLSVSDGGDSSGGVSADARQVEEPFGRAWQPTLVLLHHHLGGFQQPRGARVIAETRPRRVHCKEGNGKGRRFSGLDQRNPRRFFGCSNSKGTRKTIVQNSLTMVQNSLKSQHE